jgi:hypothetical protein
MQVPFIHEYIYIYIYIYIHTYIYIFTHTYAHIRRWRESPAEKSFVEREIPETAESADYKFHGANTASKSNPVPASNDVDEVRYRDGASAWTEVDDERRDVRSQQDKSYSDEIEEVSSTSAGFRKRRDSNAGMRAREDVGFERVDTKYREEDEDEFSFGDDRRNDSRVRDWRDDAKSRERENDFRYRERDEDVKSREKMVDARSRASTREEDFRFDNDPDYGKEARHDFHGQNDDMYQYRRGADQDNFGREQTHSGGNNVSRAPSGGYGFENSRPYSPRRR